MEEENVGLPLLVMLSSQNMPGKRTRDDSADGLVSVNRGSIQTFIHIICIETRPDIMCRLFGRMGSNSLAGKCLC